MISALNLIWVIPLSAWVGAFIMAIIAGANKE